ncbi:DUF819 family protein [Spirosoma sp. HMF4905]|uniref:DUF819 family protein n=1 Tax=Spirosoma arboris TaxID=2682092 RepID=A0A7K1SE39_9BACT|nr:DUF819 family protein [Spirosoma arboris]
MQDSLAILAVLMGNIIVAELLTRLPVFRQLGTSLTVILLTAITANLGLIPTSTNAPPLYDGIFTYLAPISIFYLLLTVNLRSLRRAGTPMVMNFFIGATGTLLGVVAGMWAVAGPKGFGQLYYALGGMFAGTYTGGSSNLNAIALHYGVNKSGNLYAAAIATDNIVTALWMGVTLLLPPLLNRYFPRTLEYNLTSAEKEQLETEANAQISEIETISPIDLAILIGLGVFGLFAAQQLAVFMPAIPKILSLTTFALILAQWSPIQKLRGVRVVSIFCIYLFLAVIGAYCDIAALLKDGQLALTMLVFVSVLVAVHFIVQFGVGALLRQDWAVISVASQACLGGSASCLALTKSLNRPDLHLPGILAGALGNAVGTYCGLLVAEYLRDANWLMG